MTNKLSEVPMALALKCLSKKPIWVKQCPLTIEKLKKLVQLVQEQLDLQHIEK